MFGMFLRKYQRSVSQISVHCTQPSSIIRQYSLLLETLDLLASKTALLPDCTPPHQPLLSLLLADFAMSPVTQRWRPPGILFGELL